MHLYLQWKEKLVDKIETWKKKIVNTKLCLRSSSAVGKMG
jgi:hypothetical protein